MTTSAGRGFPLRAVVAAEPALVALLAALDTRLVEALVLALVSTALVWTGRLGPVHGRPRRGRPQPWEVTREPRGAAGLMVQATATGWTVGVELAGPRGRPDPAAILRDLDGAGIPVAGVRVVDGGPAATVVLRFDAGAAAGAVAARGGDGEAVRRLLDVAAARVLALAARTPRCAGAGWAPAPAAVRYEEHPGHLTAGARVERCVRLTSADLPDVVRAALRPSGPWGETVVVARHVEREATTVRCAVTLRIGAVDVVALDRLTMRVLLAARRAGIGWDPLVGRQRQGLLGTSGAGVRLVPVTPRPRRRPLSRAALVPDMPR